MFPRFFRLLCQSIIPTNPLPPQPPNSLPPSLKIKDDAAEVEAVITASNVQVKKIYLNIKGQNYTKKSHLSHPKLSKLVQTRQSIHPKAEG